MNVYANSLCINHLHFNYTYPTNFVNTKLKTKKVSFCLLSFGAPDENKVELMSKSQHINKKRLIDLVFFIKYNTNVTSLCYNIQDIRKKSER